MTHCPICKASVPPGFKFCPSCGTEISVGAPSPPLPFQMSPVLEKISIKHLVTAGLTGALLCWLLLLPLSGFEPPFETWWESVGMVLLFIFSAVFMYFPMGYWLTGEWPLRNHAITMLGERTSPKRHLIFTVLGGLLLFFVFLLPPLDRDPVFADWKQMAWTCGHFIACFVLAFFLTGRWLKGEWPLGLSRILSLPFGDLASGRKGSLAGIDPRWRHVLLAGGAGLLLCLLQIIFSDVEASLQQGLRSWIWTWIVYSAFAYFPVGFWLHGEWPLSARLRAVFGEERSFRRRILLTALLTTVFYYLLVKYGTDPNDRIVMGSFWFLLMFHLMGFNTHWELSGDAAHHVLDRLGNEVPEVRKGVCEHLQQRQIPGLSIGETQIAERGLYSISRLTLDVKKTHQIMVTQGRARVILRVLPFGNDLYARWESYCDMSGRRMWLLFGFMLTLMNGFLNRWLGSDLNKISEYVWSIVLPWKGKDSTGERRQSIVPYESFGMFETLPSYILDNLYALEEAVHGSAHEVLNLVAIATGRSEKIEFSIDRSRGKKGQIF